MSNTSLLNPWFSLGFWACGIITGIMMVVGLRASPHPPVDTYIDKATGCQYLYRPHHGGITPRLDGHGHHLCTAPAVK